MELLLTVLGGFLAALAYGVVISVWRRARRPFYAPRQVKDWPDELKGLLSRAGYAPDGLVWIYDYQVELEKLRKSSVVRLGRFRRTVRSADENSLLLVARARGRADR